MLYTGALVTIIIKTCLLQVILLQHSNKMHQCAPKTIGSAADKPLSTIKTPNTLMVVEPAEATFISTTRSQYFSHLAHQIQQADGTTSFTTMTTKACETMLAATGPLRVPQPQIESRLARNLVLPKATLKPTSLTVRGMYELGNSDILPLFCRIYRDVRFRFVG